MRTQYIKPVVVLLAAFLVVSIIAPFAPLAGDSTHDGVASAAQQDEIFYTASSDNDVKAVASDTGNTIWTYSNHTARVVGIEVSPDEQYVYTASNDQTVRALYADNGTLAWNFTGHNAKVWGVAVSPSGDTVYSSGKDNSVRSIDADTGTEQWNYTGHSDNVRTVVVSASGGTVFSSGQGADVHAINRDGTQKWVFTGHNDSVYGLAVGPAGEYVYSASDDGTVRALSEDSGDEKWLYDGHDVVTAGSVRSVGVDPDGQTIYTGAVDKTVRAVSTTDGSEKWVTDVGEKVVAYSINRFVQYGLYVGKSNGYVDRLDRQSGDVVDNYTLHTDDARPQTRAFFGGTTDISGTVEEVQSGNRVPNATVEVLGVNYDALNASDKDQKAEEVLENVSDPRPPGFNESQKLLGDGGAYSEANAKYAAVHSKDQWDLSGYSVPLSDKVISTDIAPNLDDIKIVQPEDGRVVISVWDPSQEEHRYLEDDVDEKLPGQTVEERTPVVVEQMSPTGEVVNRSVMETQPYVEDTDVLGNVGTKKHHAIDTKLPRGIYKVYVKGHEETAVMYAIGDPVSYSFAWFSDLMGVNGSQTARSQTVTEYLRDGTLARRTVTTNETGHFELYVPGAVNKTTLVAYKADGEVVTGEFNPSALSLAEAREKNYNGSFYMSRDAKTYKVPENNAKLEVYKIDAALFENLAKHEGLWRQFWKNFENDIQAAMDMLFSGPLEEMTKDQLVDIREEQRDVCIDFPSACEYVDENTDHDSSQSGSSLTVRQLRQEIQLLEERINQLKGEIDNGEGSGAIENGTLDYSIEFDSRVDEESVSAFVSYENGSTAPIPDEYVSTSLTGRDSTRVSIEDYPIPKNRAVADVAVRVATEDGIGEGRSRFSNPAFSGDIPALEAIDVSSLRPGPDERVSLQIRPAENTGYQSISSVTVYGPDGNEINTTRDGEIARFKTAGEGRHSVRVEYMSQSGHRFVETFAINAVDETAAPPPSVRVAEGVGGYYGLAGDGLMSASVDVDESVGEMRVEGVAPAGDAPDQLHVFASALRDAETDITVRVLEGPDETTVRNHVTVAIHHDHLTDEALLWRDSGEPITRDSSTKYGDVRQYDNGKHVVWTYTDANGKLTYTVDKDPTFADKAKHKLAVLSPVKLPVGTVAPAAVVFGGVALVVPVGILKRRDN